MKAAWVALAAVIAGCGGAETPEPERPEWLVDRPETAGDPLLELAPAGADLVVEIDVARLRKNEVVGPLVGAIARDVTGGEFDLLAEADAVVLCSYDIGTSTAQTLTFVRGDDVGAAGEATMLDERTAVLGPPELVEVARRTAAGEADAVADPGKLAMIRDAAMPAAAPGASIRVSGVLDFDARVGLARVLQLDEVPVTISVWGDVVDDLAIVALLGGEDGSAAIGLAQSAIAWRDRVAGLPLVRNLGLAPVVRGADVEADDSTVNVTMVVPPARLQRLVARIARLVQAPDTDGP